MGESGSGKTTLAEKISQKLSIPHIHLDRFYFEAGGADARRGSEEEKRMEATLRANALAALQAESWSRMEDIYASFQKLERWQTRLFISIFRCGADCSITPSVRSNHPRDIRNFLPGMNSPFLLRLYVAPLKARARKLNSLQNMGRKWCS